MAKKRNGPYSILLVIEDATRRNNLSSRLRSQNCTVEASTGGFHTMSLLEEKPQFYDMVVIMGDMMDMSAYEQTSLIRTTYSAEQLKILYLYPKGKIEDSKEVKEVGATNVIEDNDRFDAIMKVIESHR